MIRKRLLSALATGVVIFCEYAAGATGTHPLIFGPDILVRDTGKATILSRTISAPNPGNGFTVDIVNGESHVRTEGKMIVSAFRADGASGSVSSRLYSRPDRGSMLFAISVGTYAGASAADAATSWGKREANPLLASGNRFSGSSVAVKGGIAGAVLAVEWLLLRRDPSFRRTFTFLNFTVSGVLGGVAARNAGVR